MTTSQLRNSINRSPLRLALLLVPLLLVCFGLSPTVRAVLPAPTPDGGYPNGNTAEGTSALHNLTTGVQNTALGNSTLLSDTTASFNTATGYQALRNNTANNNTATGSQALLSNTIGISNTATGSQALFKNSDGHDNVATGRQALFFNSQGSYGTASGQGALEHNTTGNFNTAVGQGALIFNTANDNTAIGFQASSRNTSAPGNTAVGNQALFANTSGFSNTAVGNQALMNVNGANGGGNGNIGIGWKAGENIVSGSNNICIGHPGTNSGFGSIYIGNGAVHEFCQIGCSQFSVPAILSHPFGEIGEDVVVLSDGTLGFRSSSRRFKQDIADMDAASEVLLSLRPVTFHGKKAADNGQNPMQFGLIAEEVDKVCPDLVGRDAKGEVRSVHYTMVNAMLLNEFLKEHKRVQQQAGKIEEQDRKLEKQEATIAQLKKGMELLTASLKEQGAQIRKVSDQVELTKPAPRTVLNDQ